ncbi:hypothetical protein D9M71_720500 [compost metagenome]
MSRPGDEVDAISDVFVDAAIDQHEVLVVDGVLHRLIPGGDDGEVGEVAVLEAQSVQLPDTDGDVAYQVDIVGRHRFLDHVR